MWGRDLSMSTSCNMSRDKKQNAGSTKERAKSTLQMDFQVNTTTLEEHSGPLSSGNVASKHVSDVTPPAAVPVPGVGRL